MTWLLGTMAGVIIWTALIRGIGACIHYGNPTDEIEATDWAEWEQEINR